MRRNGKKILSLLLALLIFGGLFSGCGIFGGGEESSSSSEIVTFEPKATAIYKIGLIQYMEHSSLDAIREAFMNRLEEWGYNETKVTIDYQNAAGSDANVGTICQKFVTDEVDMIVAISTPAAKQAMEATKDTDIKVLFAAVGDPATELMMTDLTAPTGNITGTCDKVPVTDIIDLALQIDPGIKTFGLLYSPQESGSAADAKEARTYLESKNIAVTEGTVASSTEAAEVARNLAAETDAVFTSTDNSIASAIDSVTAVMNEAKKPYFVGSDSMVQAGALLSSSVDYGELGAKNADMAIEIIEGKEIKEMPVVVYTEHNIYINQTTLSNLTLLIPDEIGEKAIYMQ